MLRKREVRKERKKEKEKKKNGESVMTDGEKIGEKSSEKRRDTVCGGDGKV